jgi:hypothetical protein
MKRTGITKIMGFKRPKRRAQNHAIWGHVVIQIPALMLIAIPLVKLVGCAQQKNKTAASIVTSKESKELKE